MRNRRKKPSSKLILYVIVSLVLHLTFFYLFPLGSLAGVAGGEDQEEDFGYIQVVEYQPLTQTSDSAGESPDHTPGKKEESEPEKEKPPEEEPPPETETKQETEENIDEPKTETEPESEEKEITEPEEETVPEVVKEQEQSSQVEESDAENSGESEQDVITSDESDVEINVSEEEESSSEESEPATEGEQASEEKSEPEEEPEPEKSPPPPPTTGELISLSPTPNYPKDLIGEARTGRVEMIVDVNTGGNIKNVEIINSSQIEKIDRTARLTIERGWKFKAYNKPYSIPIEVKYNIDEQGNPQIDVELGEVNFKEVN